VVLLDAGDALARIGAEGKGGAASPEERAAFRFIVEAMGSLGYDAMAVGERDLRFGVQELKKRAAAAKIPLLAANLVDKAGKRPFEERRLLEAGGLKVGVFAVVSGESFGRSGLTVLPPLEQANLQAKALREAGAELVVALLHLPYDASVEVARALVGVDYAVQAHDGRVNAPRLVGKTLLTAAGERGRQLGSAAIELGSEGGPLFDRAEAKSARQQLGYLDQTIARTRTTLEAMPEGPGRKAQAQMLETLVKRRDDLQAQVEAGVPPGRSSVLTDLTTLDGRVAEDPEMARRTAAADPHKLR
jgi:2',3'-cyclic-nucleotide 2'-phosphodiesterase (5'-nucleotidase family)